MPNKANIMFKLCSWQGISEILQHLAVPLAILPLPSDGNILAALRLRCSTADPSANAAFCCEDVQSKHLMVANPLPVPSLCTFEGKPIWFVLTALFQPLFLDTIFLYSISRAQLPTYWLTVQWAMGELQQVEINLSYEKIFEMRLCIISSHRAVGRW